MESQTGEGMGPLSEGLAQMEARLEARLEAAATIFERAMALIEERDGDVRRIVAAVESGRAGAQESGREADLTAKLAAAEQQIADLRAQIQSKSAAQSAPARKTVPASTAQFLAKQGLSTLDSVEAGALDAALDGLSLEQRIAVKAQLLRAGVLA